LPEIVIVTGGAGGLGRVYSLALAEAGYGVIVADLADPAGVVAEIEAAGGAALGVNVDVSDLGSAEAMAGATLERFGRIDALVNNAAYYTAIVKKPFEELTVEEWDLCFAVNVRGTFLCCKYAIPHMIEAGGGAIVNTASVAGLVGLKNRAAYCASKGAVVSLTRAIAIDHVRQKIRCNCICPGTVDSPWVGRLLDAASDPAAERSALVARQPMGRLGTPEEVAKAAVYLASDEADFVTGSALVIDGGLTAQ
jgi:NAD(P)-dependent dehydrogenase (short-subunit alcohol dehydrogenase family)